MDSPELSKLCDRCQGLELSDNHPEATVARDEYGAQFLKVPGTYHQRKPWIFPTKTGWMLEDSLPHLHALEDSGRSGCDLCRLLHERILYTDSVSPNPERDILTRRGPCDVRIHLRYRYGPPNTDPWEGGNIGVLLLIASLYMDNEDHTPSFVFKVEASRGISNAFSFLCTGNREY